LRPGEIAFAVMSESNTNEPHRLIAASVGLAIPRDRNIFGYLSEHHSHGETEKQAADYAEDLAAGMLATTLGLGFDADKSWDANREIYELSDHIVTARNVTQSAVGDKNGLWTTVIAAAIFVEFDID
jgi:arginine decarboxylase